MIYIYIVDIVLFDYMHESHMSFSCITVDLTTIDHHPGPIHLMFHSMFRVCHKERNAPTVLRYYVAPGSELYHFMSGRVAPFRVGGCPGYIGGKLSPCSPSPVLLQKLDVRCAPSVERHGRGTQVIVDDNVFWGDVEQRHRQGFLLFWLFAPSNILKTPLMKGAATQTESVSIR